LKILVNPPPLIVVDRLADERLRAEVLNQGGFDLLMEPFDKPEGLGVLSRMACADDTPFSTSQRSRLDRR
jgi:hypothetical protein